MDMEIALLLNLFSDDTAPRGHLRGRLERWLGRSGSSEKVRQKQLTEAFWAHLVAQILWEFDEDRSLCLVFVSFLQRNMT